MPTPPTVSDEYDVAVLGSGISGLLIASELAKHLSVVLVEERSTIPKTKYWLTDTGSAKKNPELAGAIDCHYRSLDFIGFEGTTYRCQGSYVLWNTERLVDHLVDTFRSRGGTILTRHTFYSYRYERDALVLFANDKALRVALAVDCMGYGSPTIYAQGIVDIRGYYLLYGGTFRLAGSLQPVGLHNLVLGAQPTYVEAFPGADDELHLVLILPVRDARKPTTLRDAFSFLINRSPYSRLIEGPRSPDNFLGGVIPVGRLRKAALDRMFFFGEAGQYNPAASATALTRILYTYSETATNLVELAEQGRLSRKDLAAARVRPTTWVNERIQRFLFQDILRWDSNYFSEMVAELERAGDHVLMNDLIFGNLSFETSLSAETIANLVRKKCWRLARTLFRGAASLTRS